MTPAEQLQRARLLQRNCLKHQVFREKPQEAEKMAEAGWLYSAVAAAPETDPVDRLVYYQCAQECLARAKRLCRDLLRDSAKRHPQTKATP